jgi:hypothetical protein
MYSARSANRGEQQPGCAMGANVEVRPSSLTRAISLEAGSFFSIFNTASNTIPFLDLDPKLELPERTALGEERFAERHMEPDYNSLFLL